MEQQEGLRILHFLHRSPWLLFPLEIKPKPESTKDKGSISSFHGVVGVDREQRIACSP